jgi:hypothetical protein
MGAYHQGGEHPRELTPPRRPGFGKRQSGRA